ncbi:uncharacterized protein METZ01_LOCUS198536 [marine metagenome]|uniref:Uncharacterized protein n=1 Tax=marine metagenome TaxID=408172 RepID=A0A382E5S5_9ZZZZ
MIDIDLQVLETVEGISSRAIESKIRNYHKRNLIVYNV